MSRIYSNSLNPRSFRSHTHHDTSEFLEATRRRLVIVPGGLDMALQTKHEAALSSTWPTSAQSLVSLPPNIFLEARNLIFRIMRQSTYFALSLGYIPHVSPRPHSSVTHVEATPLSTHVKEELPHVTAALSNAVELPPCPADMCKPLYAALVFGHHCFVSPRFQCRSPQNACLVIKH